MLIRQLHQKSAIFGTIGIFLHKGFPFQRYVLYGCHNALMTSINPSDVAILNIIGADYCCIINSTSKSEAVT